jgi:putative transposase
VRLRYIQPGKPFQNPFVEGFIGRFRDDCLNQHWVGSRAEPAPMIRQRPHSVLDYRPSDFARRTGALGLISIPRPSPALTPALGPRYDVNGSPSP